MYRGLIADSIANFTCHFMETTESLICQWKMEESELAGETESSLILSSINGFQFCEPILFIGTKVNITLKIQNTMTREERFSGPHYAYFKEIVKTPRPIITKVMTSHKSLNVTWTTANVTTGSCKIRHKPYSSDPWSTITVPLMHHGNKRMYMIDSLQPLTLYTVSVSCQYGLYGNYGAWSDWSKERSGMTSESAPSSLPRVCYHSEDVSATGTHRILLLWKAIPAAYPHGFVLGYRVSYMPSYQPHLKRSVTTSSPKAILVVTRAVYDIDVTAFNRAGQSPAQHLRVTAGPHHNVSSVRGLWVYSKDGKLWVQWDADSAMSEFAVESVAEANPNNTDWTWIQGSGHVVTNLRGEPKQTYNISVYPILGTKCGAPSTLQANLETGALVYMVGLRVAMVTRQEAIIKWTWQRKPYQINIIQYSLMLRRESGSDYIPVTPDMSEYLFSALKSSTDYSVHLFAKTHDKSISIEKQDFTTLEGDLPQEIVTVVVPLLMIIIATSVFSIMSRVLYRKYIILQVADPEQSAAVRWLTASSMTGDQKVLQVVDLCYNETNEIYVETTCLMLDDSKRASQDMNSIYGTDDSMHSGGSRYSLTFKGLAISSLTPSNTGHGHSVPFSEKSDWDERVCASVKPGYVDTIPRPMNAAVQENFTFKGSIDYVEAEGIPIFAQGIAVNSVHTMNNSESISPKNNITDLDSVPQLFKGYVSNMPTNVPYTGMIPFHANSDPPQARTDYGETAPSWGSVALSEPRSEDNTSTVLA